MLTHSFNLKTYPTLQEIKKELLTAKEHKPKSIHSVTSVHDKKTESWKTIIIYVL